MDREHVEIWKVLYDGVVVIDRVEVVDYTWVSLPELTLSLSARPADFIPWLKPSLKLLTQALKRVKIPPVP